MLLLIAFFSAEPFFDDSLNLIDVDDHQQTILPVKSPEFLCWKISEISTRDYNDVDDQVKKEHVLQLTSVNDEEQTAVCHLRDDWYLMETLAQDIAYVSSM